MRYLLAILLTCLPVHAASATLTAPDFTLPSPWTYSASSDTPEGSWVAPLVSQPSISTGPISLPATFNGGTPVKLFLKWLDYDSGASFTATAGGTTTPSETFDDRDDNQYWTDGVVFTPVSSFSTITLTFTRFIAHDGRLIAFYLTTDTNEIVLRDDRAIAFAYPASGSAVVNANPFNYAPNSSFEAGPPGAWWRIIVANGNSRTNSLWDLWSTTIAFDGTRSVALPIPAAGGGTYSIQSNPFDVGSNEVATASVYFRTVGANSTANIRIRSFYDAPSGFPATLERASSTTATAAGWTRLSVTWTNLYYPNGQYYVELLGQGITIATTLYADALKIERGTTTSTYSTSYPVEFAAYPSEPTQVFHTTDVSPTLTVRAWNSSGAPLTRTIGYTIYNWTNGVVATNTVTLAPGAGAAASTTIAVSPTSLGHHRIWLTLTNQSSDTELTYLMQRPPAFLTSLRTNSLFGTHLNLSASALARAQRLGVKWTRTVSLSRLRWNEVQTASNTFVYPSLNLFTNYAISIMGNVGESGPPPAYVGTNIAAQYARYATNLVANYGTLVPVWELWNEPDQSPYLPSLYYYGEMVQAAAPAIRSYTASGILAGGGVLTPAQITNFMAAVSSTNAIDGFTVHEYPPNEVVAPSLQSQVIVPYGKPVWNTEAGVTDKGSYTFSRAPWRYAGHYLVTWKSSDLVYDSFANNVRDISRDFLTCLAYGQRTMFYYDGGQRNIEPHDFASRQFSYLDYDDSVRVKGAGLAGLWGILDEAVGQGSFTPGDPLIAYAYVKGLVPYVAYWTSSTNLLDVALDGGLNPANLRLFDMMGNIATPASTILTATPVPTLVQGTNGMSLGTLTAAFTGATVSERTDVTAPTLSFATLPRTSTDPRAWRWLALDESGSPAEANPNAITYRYSFNDEPYSSWDGTTWLERGGTVTGLTVQARDLAGNISTITFGSNTPEPPVGSTNPPVIIDGRVRLRGGVNLFTTQ